MTISAPGITQTYTEPIQELLETASLYLHIPFCHTRCHYCDFNTYAGILPLRGPYVRALLTEIAASGTFARLPSGRPRRSRTIFFGGGTPSLIDPEALRLLLDAVPGSPWREATMEAAPGTVTPDRIRVWRECGINRVAVRSHLSDLSLACLGILSVSQRNDTPRDARAFERL